MQLSYVSSFGTVNFFKLKENSTLSTSEQISSSYPNATEHASNSIWSTIQGLTLYQPMPKSGLQSPLTLNPWTSNHECGVGLACSSHVSRKRLIQNPLSCNGNVMVYVSLILKPSGFV